MTKSQEKLSEQTSEKSFKPDEIIHNGNGKDKRQKWLNGFGIGAGVFSYVFVKVCFLVTIVCGDLNDKEIIIIENMNKGADSTFLWMYLFIGIVLGAISLKELKENGIDIFKK